jgi:hypothetical protein
MNIGDKGNRFLGILRQVTANPHVRELQLKAIAPMKKKNVDLIHFTKSFHGRQKDLYKFLKYFESIRDKFYLQEDVTRLISKIRPYGDITRESPSFVYNFINFVAKYWPIFPESLKKYVYERLHDYELQRAQRSLHHPMLKMPPSRFEHGIYKFDPHRKHSPGHHSPRHLRHRHGGRYSPSHRLIDPYYGAHYY